MSAQVQVVSGSWKLSGDMSDQVMKMMLQVARGYAFLNVSDRRRQVDKSKSCVEGACREKKE